MKRLIPALLLAAPLLASAAIASEAKPSVPVKKPAPAPTVVVDPDGYASTTNCNDGSTQTPYTTISSALASAVPGETIIVCPAVYDEQLTLPVRVILQGTLGATLKPSAMTANSTNTINSKAVAAGILVAEAGSGSVIDGMTVDTASYASSGLGCTDDLAGVYFHNASGKVSHSVVKNVRIGEGQEGCQSGFGILAQAASGATTVRVNTSSIHDFQKDGIVANTSGVTLSAQLDTVTGDGPTPNIAQNGIEIAFGAAGLIDQNFVEDVDYSLCSTPSDSDCQNGSATGIIVYQADPNVQISNNSITSTQGAIYVQGNNTGRIFSNRIRHTVVYDGISISGNGIAIEGNSIVDSDESGIYIDGDNSYLIGNSIIEAPVGILVDSGSNNYTPTDGDTVNNPSDLSHTFDVAVPVSLPNVIAIDAGNAAQAPLAGKAATSPKRGVAKRQRRVFSPA